jgi:hypothetical protein
MTLIAAYGLDSSLVSQEADPVNQDHHQHQHQQQQQQQLPQQELDQQQYTVAELESSVPATPSSGRDALPPPPTMENAFYVSVAPIVQQQPGVLPSEVALIVSIGPVLFRKLPSAFI